MFLNKKIYPIFVLVLLSALFSAGFTTRASAMESEKQVECLSQKIEIDPVYISMCKEIKAQAEKERNRQEEIRKKEEDEAAARRKEQEELLASIIFCEAGNQSYTGQVAVGAVVMNRLNHSNYPDSMEEVIYQKGQFSPVSTGWLDKVRNSQGYTDSAMSAAKDALNGVNPVGNCLFFDRGGSGLQIGDHFFH